MSMQKNVLLTLKESSPSSHSEWKSLINSALLVCQLTYTNRVSPCDVRDVRTFLVHESTLH